MKKLITSLFSIFIISALNSSDLSAGTHEDHPADYPSGQELKLTATTTAATRLFGTKDDLTSVIMVLPKGSVVEITGTDTTYYRVIFEDYEGFILRRHAKPDEPAVVTKPPVVKAEPVIREPEPLEVQQRQQGSRFSYLEQKYGSQMASRMAAGKIWKGMTSEMVSDTWGTPQKINRVVSGNTVKEEWIYKNTWLYIEDDVLREWGPVKQ
ncbi:MAG: hypothetical protein JXR66_01430 [Bacteroidales bacterium]|nr:hypothetical protein [Bacteroidales bacterium]MBN2632187.1 hypothetical protein [Bacteroidales bacterium]